MVKVIVLSLWFILLAEVGGALGIVEYEFGAVSIFTPPAESGFFNYIVALAVMLANSVAVFGKFILFQVDIPPVINFFIFYPINLGIFYLVFVMIRGGARD